MLATARETGDPYSTEEPIPIALEVLIEQLEFLFDHRQ
jgi:hypothetical protein